MEDKYKMHIWSLRKVSPSAMKKSWFNAIDTWRHLRQGALFRDKLHSMVSKQLLPLTSSTEAFQDVGRKQYWKIGGSCSARFLIYICESDFEMNAYR